MAGYKWDKFGGLRPLATALRLQPNEAAEATNVDLRRGVLRPRDTQAAWNSAIHPSLLVTADVPSSSFSMTAGEFTASGTVYTGYVADVDNQPFSAIGSVVPDPAVVLDDYTAILFYYDSDLGNYVLILEGDGSAPPADAFDRLRFINDNDDVVTLPVDDIEETAENPFFRRMWRWQRDNTVSEDSQYTLTFYGSGPIQVPQTLFRFIDRSTDDTYWMYWTMDVDVAAGPVENAEQRHYYTGDGLPKMFTKDSIIDETPPYPEVADDKYPKTWYFLGVPAPAAAPTIDGDSYVPPDTAKSGVITGLVTSNLVLRFHPRRPSRLVDKIKSELNGVSNDVSGNTHMDSDAGAMVMEVMRIGTRAKVTEIVDADHVRIVGVQGNGYLEEFQDNYDDPVPENRMDERWHWDADEVVFDEPVVKASDPETYDVYRHINGKSNDICWTYHVPDSVVIEVGSHALKLGDVVRVVSVASPMLWSSATRLLAGPPINNVNYGVGRQRALTDPGEATIEFAGGLTYFVERDGREFDPTIEDVQVDTREPTTRAYVYTYVTALGEEGPPSAPTDPFTLALGDSVAVEGFTTPPTGHRNITTYRIYRANTGSSETAFQFVADVPIASTTYTDAVADDALGEVLQSETWDPPPEAMLGVVAMPNQFLAGFFENVLCFSEPGFPHAWPVDYRMPLDVEIVGIKVAGGSLIVATKGTPYIVAGTHPRQMASRRVEEPSPCVDKRSVVDCGDVVVYASTDGLIAGSNEGFNNITQEYFTREQWKLVVGATNATTRSARAWFVDGEYLLRTTWIASEFEGEASGGAGYVFDFRGSKQLQITAFEQTFLAAFTDPKDGELYYVLTTEDQAELTIEDGVPAGYLPIFRWRYLYPTTPAEPEQLWSTLQFTAGVDGVSGAITGLLDGQYGEVGTRLSGGLLDSLGHQVGTLPGDPLGSLFIFAVVSPTPLPKLTFTSVRIVELDVTLQTAESNFTYFSSGDHHWDWGNLDPPVIIDDGETYNIEIASTATRIPGGSIGSYRSGIVMLPRPMAIAVVKVLCRRTRTSDDQSFGEVSIVLRGYRYDGASGDGEDSDEGNPIELCSVELINGDSNDSEWPGEQRSKPFRIDKNLLVDALDFSAHVEGTVEIEAIYVAESFDDLLMLES